MQICPICGYQNPDGITICLGCASTLAPLPTVCPTCGAPISAEDQVAPLGTCQACGADLAAISAAQAGRLSRQERMLRELQSSMPTPLREKVAAAPRLLAGQRREVSVLRARVFDFDGLLELIDSEQLYLLMDRLLRQLAEVVHRYEGTVDLVLEDGLLAIFGLPLNHENDPERAVRAALEMQAAVKPLLRAAMKELYGSESGSAAFTPIVAIQLGVHTGLVVAGSPDPQAPGLSARVGYSAVGDTVKLANHLAEAAEPGGILVSFATFQRTNPVIEYGAPRQLKLYGLKQPLPIYAPGGVRQKPGQIRGLPGLQVPMVGRREDLQCLLETWQSIQQIPRPRFIFIQGEAGLGKSRLVEEFRKAADLPPSQFFLASCSTHMRITPYRVLADLVRRMLQLSEQDPPERQAAQVEQQLRRITFSTPDGSQPEVELLPYILQVLDLPQSDPTFIARLRVLPPEMLQRQIETALLTFLLSPVFPLPRVIVCDDLHWVDPASANFLRFFCQAVESEGVMLLLVGRDFRDPPELAALAEQARQEVEGEAEAARVQWLNLLPLSEAEMDQLLRQLLPGEAEHEAELENLRRRVIELASGNPYYAEELVRMLIDLGGLAPQTPPAGWGRGQAGLSSVRWLVTSLADELLRSVPGTLSDLILARFDRLPLERRQLLQQMSVLGDVLSPQWLRVLVDQEPEALEAELSALVESQFLVQHASGESYRWKHPLIPITIHDTLTRQDRQRLHHRVAQAVEAGYPYLPAERVDLLALHYAESPVPEKALTYLLQAAENSLMRSANRPAVEHFSRLLDLSRQYYGPSLCPLWRVYIGLGKALKFLSDFGGARRALEEGVRELLQLPREDLQPLGWQFLIEGLSELADLMARQGELALALERLQQGMDLLNQAGVERQPVLWRRLADRLAWVYFRQGRLEEAFQQAEQALQGINWLEEEDPIVIASLNNTLGGIYWTRSRYAEALRCVERSLEIYTHLNYTWGMAIALTNMGVLNFSLENWTMAKANFERADQLRVQYGYILERPTNLRNLGELLICQGEFERARRVLEISQGIGRRLGLPLAWGYAEIGLARLAAVQSDWDGLERHLRAAQGALAADLEGRTDRSAQLCQLQAQLALARGESEAALEAVQRGLRIAQSGGFSQEEIDLLRTWGMVLAQRGERPAAIDQLTASLRKAEAVEDRYRQGLALLQLGELYAGGALTEAEAGEKPRRLPSPTNLRRARQALQRAEEFFAALGAQAMAERARKGLLRLQEEAARSGAAGEPLEAGQRQGGGSFASEAVAGELPEGEWRRAVVLNLQLSPLPDEDPELIFEAYSRLLPLLNRLAQESGGLPVQQPDRFLIFYGVPTAHEDDALRAVETAVKVAAEFRSLGEEVQGRLTVQMGIAAGVLVTGAAAELGRQITGEPLKQAARLAQSGANLQIWVTDPVRQATAHRYDFLPSETAHGLVYRLIGPAAKPRPARGLIGLQTPFIGRQQELQTLLQACQALEQRRGGLVWVEGEAGMGKSRLLREFSQRLQDRPWHIWYGACSSRQTERAFSLFANLLQQVFDLFPDFPAEQAYAALDQKLAAWPEALLESRPFLELLLGLRPRLETQLPGTDLLGLEPEQLRRQIFVQVRRFFGLLAQQQPVILLLDDVHWIDSVSADLLIFLSQLTVTAPLLLVCAQRLGEPTAEQHALERLKTAAPGQKQRIIIQPFNEQESFSLLDALLAKPAVSEGGTEGRTTWALAGRAERLPLAQLQQSALTQVFGTENLALLIRQSGGNPYFIEEFIRMLLEQQVLRLSEGQLEVVQPIRPEMIKAPASLEALIRTRVDALPERARKLLQSASVLGSQLSRSVLQNVSQMDDIQTELGLLRERGMLELQGQTASGLELWQFSHPLIETTVYNSILRVQREVMHARAAQALAEEWGDQAEEHAEELAYHLLKARQDVQAIHYLILSGERAAQRYANEEALGFFEQANQILLRLPEADLNWRFRIAVGLGSVHLFTGNYDASAQALRSLLPLAEEGRLSVVQHASLHRLLGEVAQRRGDSTAALQCFKQALQALGEPRQRQAWAEAARIADRQSWTYFQSGAFDRAERSCQQALIWAGLGEDLNTRAHVENTLGGIYYRQGNFEAALHHTRQAMNVWEQLGYTWGVAASLGNQGILEVTAGNWQRAQENFQRSLQLCQEMGDVEGVARLENNLGLLALLRGDLSEAEALFRHSLDVARPLQIAYHAANSSLGLAQALLYQGQLEQAQQALTEGLQTAREANLEDLTAEMGRAQAEIYLAQGALPQAAQTAQQAAEQAHTLGDRVIEASAWRIYGEVCLQKQDLEAAQRALERAWQAMETGVDELEAGRIHAFAARLAQAAGRTADVPFHRAQAANIFFRLGARRDLELLEQLGT